MNGLGKSVQRFSAPCHACALPAFSPPPVFSHSSIRLRLLPALMHPKFYAAVCFSLLLKTLSRSLLPPSITKFFLLSLLFLWKEKYMERDRVGRREARGGERRGRGMFHVTSPPRLLPVTRPTSHATPSAAAPTMPVCCHVSNQTKPKTPQCTQCHAMKCTCHATMPCYHAHSHDVIMLFSLE